MDFHKTAVLNGHFRPVREVRLDPTSGGVLSGWGVYTTVRIYYGLPFNLSAHRQRLEKDARAVGLPLPRAFENLEADLTDLARRNSLEEGLGRIVLLGGAVGRFTGGGLAAADLLVLTRDLRSRPPGEALWPSPHRLHSAHPLAGVKVTSNMPYIQCRRDALRHQCDDALLLNESEHIVEVSTGNLFWFRGGVLHTPALETGCLGGTTRSLVLDLAGKHDTPVAEGRFSMAELLAADEVFVSSVSREIGPVVRIGEQAFAAAPGPGSAALQESFQAMLRAWARTAAPREEPGASPPEEPAA